MQEPSQTHTTRPWNHGTLVSSWPGSLALEMLLAVGDDGKVQRTVTAPTQAYPDLVKQ
eukprot:COSAG01_NODE_995_length_12234_cov_3.196193_7_plen_58_part_00